MKPTRSKVPCVSVVAHVEFASKIVTQRDEGGKDAIVANHQRRFRFLPRTANDRGRDSASRDKEMPQVPGAKPEPQPPSKTKTCGRCSPHRPQIASRSLTVLREIIRSHRRLGPELQRLANMPPKPTLIFETNARNCASSLCHNSS